MKKKISWSRIVWGLSLIIASGLIIAELLGYLPKNLSWYRITVSSLLGGSALVSLLKKQFANSIFALTFIVIVNKSVLEISASIWMILLVGTLLAIGTSLLLNDKSIVIHGDIDEMDSHTSSSQGVHHITSVFGSHIRTIRHELVSYIKVESVFSTLDIMLDKASITSGATIEIDNVFSKTRIYVQSDVQVVTSTQNVFARVHNFGFGKSEGNVLYIKGDNVFGKIEIIHV